MAGVAPSRRLAAGGRARRAFCCRSLKWSTPSRLCSARCSATRGRPRRRSGRCAARASRCPSPRVRRPSAPRAPPVPALLPFCSPALLLPRSLPSNQPATHTHSHTPSSSHSPRPNPTGAPQPNAQNWQPRPGSQLRMQNPACTFASCACTFRSSRLLNLRRAARVRLPQHGRAADALRRGAVHRRAGPGTRAADAAASRLGCCLSPLL